jgi:oligopeptide/dipeptide ABC transporter ATP-binding protein
MAADGSGDGPPHTPGLPLVSAEDVVKDYVIRRSPRRSEVVSAVDGVSFTVRRGETFGLVGESGSGKSTLARCLLHLTRLTAGRVIFDGQPLGELSPAGLRMLRRHMQMVFQDPLASLNPRMTVLESLCEPLTIHGVGNRAHRREQAAAISEMVGISAELLGRKPHQVSGGQRQRVALARALILRPDLLVLDEPVSSLDVSVQAQVLNLLVGLQETLRLTYVFIAHDLVVAEYFCDRIAVLYAGRVVELATSAAFFGQARHPYSVALLSASPDVNRPKQRRLVLADETSARDRAISGCAFRPRCPVGHDRVACAQDTPALTETEPGHWAACHYPGELVVRPSEKEVLG